jgi:hypothetical protein
MANRNWANKGNLYMMEVKPILLSCNFIVDSSNGNGLGIRSLKGAGIQNVFMHTSQTPGAGNSNPATPNQVITNPNPASGVIIVQMQDNYARLLGGDSSIVSPVSGSALKIDNSALTAGTAYVISTLGNATLAKWQAIGVPVGVVPAVGVAFIAKTNGGSGNTLSSRVMATAAAGSGISSIETVGDSNLAIAPSIISQGFGAQIILQCFAQSVTMNSYTPAGTITNGTPDTFAGTPAVLTGSSANAITAPADNSVINLNFLMSDSSVTSGQGE